MAEKEVKGTGGKGIKSSSVKDTAQKAGSVAKDVGSRAKETAKKAGGDAWQELQETADINSQESPQEYADRKMAETTQEVKDFVVSNVERDAKKVKDKVETKVRDKVERWTDERSERNIKQREQELDNAPDSGRSDNDSPDWERQRQQGRQQEQRQRNQQEEENRHDERNGRSDRHDDRYDSNSQPDRTDHSPERNSHENNSPDDRQNEAGRSTSSADSRTASETGVERTGNGNQTYTGNESRLPRSTDSEREASGQNEGKGIKQREAGQNTSAETADNGRNPGLDKVRRDYQGKREETSVRDSDGSQEHSGQPRGSEGGAPQQGAEVRQDVPHSGHSMDSFEDTAFDSVESSGDRVRSQSTFVRNTDSRIHTKEEDYSHTRSERAKRSWQENQEGKGIKQKDGSSNDLYSSSSDLTEGRDTPARKEAIKSRYSSKAETSRVSDSQTAGDGVTVESNTAESLNFSFSGSDVVDGVEVFRPEGSARTVNTEAAGKDMVSAGDKSAYELAPQASQSNSGVSGKKAESPARFQGNDYVPSGESVTSSARTDGATVSAPNGNVTVARNKVSVRTGQNIKASTQKTASVQKNVRNIKQTARSTGQRTIKTADKSIKGAGKTLKTSEQAGRVTIKTTEASGKAAVKGAQTSVKAAQASAKASAKAAQTSAKAAKAVAKIIKDVAIALGKALVALVKAIAAFLAEGGWVVVVVIVAIVGVAGLIGWIFGFFHGDSSSSLGAGSRTLKAVMTEIIEEYKSYPDELHAQNSGAYIVLEGYGDPEIKNAFAVFAAEYYADPNNNCDINNMSEADENALRAAFYKANVRTVTKKGEWVRIPTESAVTPTPTPTAKPTPTPTPTATPTPTPTPSPTPSPTPTLKPPKPHKTPLPYEYEYAYINLPTPRLLPMPTPAGGLYANTGRGLLTSEDALPIFAAGGPSGIFAKIDYRYTSVYRTLCYVKVTHPSLEELKAQLPEDKRDLFDLYLDVEAEEWSSIMTDFAVERASNEEFSLFAKGLVGSTDHGEYWRWFGFDRAVYWDGCFISWCAEQFNYIKNGVIPKFGHPQVGVNWFKWRGLWKEPSATPEPGMIVFFDWDDTYANGPKDGKVDCAGIVESVSGRTMYVIMVDPNNFSKVVRKQYSLSNGDIMGYGAPEY